MPYYLNQDTFKQEKRVFIILISLLLSLLIINYVGLYEPPEITNAETQCLNGEILIDDKCVQQSQSISQCLGNYSDSLDTDNKVDVNDFATFAKYYNKTLSNTDTSTYDLINEDNLNILNLEDFSLFAMNFNQEVCKVIK